MWSVIWYHLHEAYKKEPDLVGATSDMLHKLLWLQSAPDVDIETFDGNALNYHFIALLGKLLKV